MIAQYPVTIKEFQEMFEKQAGDPENAKYIKESTWMEAIKYYNLLNIKKKNYRCLMMKILES